MLMTARQALKEDGLLIIALVLPFRPYVECKAHECNTHNTKLASNPQPSLHCRFQQPRPVRTSPHLRRDIRRASGVVHKLCQDRRRLGNNLLDQSAVPV